MVTPLPTPTTSNEPPVVRLAVRVAAVCLVVSVLTLLTRRGGGGETSLVPSPTTTTSTTLTTDTTLFPEFPPLPESASPASTFDTIPPPTGQPTGAATSSSGSGATPSRPTATTARPAATTTTAKKTTATTTAPSGNTGSGNAAAAGATREGTLNGRTYKITGVYTYRSTDPGCDALCATSQVDATDGTGVGSDVTATASWVDRNGTITAFGQTEWQTSWNPPRAASRNGPSTDAGATVTIIVRLQHSNGQAIFLRSDPTAVQQL